MPEIKGADNAYIFFTSGSTGVPKGVLGNHQGLSHFINWQRECFGVTQNDRIAQLTHLSFDVFLRDLFLPLTSGATLYIPLARDLLDPLSWVKREDISIIHTVPSILHSWLNGLQNKAQFQNLRYLFIAGEPLTDVLVKNWRQAYPQSGQIINLYGPTETTLAKLFYVVPDATLDGIQPVGQSLPQTQALILNQAGGLCGVGEIGQIVIRTPFRTQGYINNPEQTRNVFRKNPFNNDEQDIIYYTGDLGCYRADGIVAILGRIDNQIKIRGVRIEPEEITAILAKHPAVFSSATMVIKEIGHHHLVNYMVLKDSVTITIAELRSYLSQYFSQVMIPEKFVFLDKIPLKANGKIDWDMLPEPTQLEFKQHYVPPRSPIEEMLAGIWQEVLRIDRVSIYDNFFELGGHSLLALQVIVRIKQQFQIDFPLYSLFDKPSIAEISTQLETELKQTKSEAIELIETISRDQAIKASFAQQRLWFLDHLLGASSLYNIPRAIRLSGALNISALQQSLTAMIERHEVFRTAFAEQDGGPLQLISASIPFQCRQVDLSALPQDARESESIRILDTENKPFDLKQAPLIRALLLKLSTQEHILLVTLHHIISDGWSMGIFQQELTHFYNAFSKGQSPALAELPIQYADYSVWQREWLQGEVLEKQLSYWKNQLADSPVLDLPSDYSRPQQLSYQGARESIQLSKELTQNLKTLSQNNGVTLFMTLLAAFQVLLHRYSGQDDIVVGSPIAGRNKQEIEGLIGFFVNSLALRTSLSETPSFDELLSRVRKVCLEAYTHQDVPFEKLVAELQPQRDMSRHPFFQVMLVLLVLQPTAEQTLQLSGLNTHRVTVHNPTSKFDLTVSLQESSEGLKGFIEYSTDLFDATTTCRFAGHFQTLLEAIVKQPEMSIAELPILTATERHQILVEWNDTQTDYPKDKCIHQLFEEQVARTPNAIALVFEDQQLSYQELNTQANQLAHYLKNKGISTEPLVGICMDRCVDMVIGLLAILKAGGAYVPLDPTYPAERLAFILEDTQLSIVIIHQRVQSILPNTPAIRIIIVDGDTAKTIEQQSGKNLSLKLFSHQPAYLIFTSGSTGTPKGVVTPHRAVSRLVFGVDYAHINAEQIFLMLAPTTFDASTFELWGALLHGAQCIIYPDRIPTSYGLEKIIQRYQVNILWLTTSLFNAIIDEKPSVLKNVTQILTGGEALSKSHIQRALEQLPNSQLINGYGPTESTTFTCCYKVNIRPTPIQ